MKRIFSIFLLLIFVLSGMVAQTVSGQEERPFVGHFYCKDADVHIHLNLYDAIVEVPNFSFLGKMNGYMLGSIYGTWMTVSHKVKDHRATIRFVNDIGSDTQTVEFTQVNDSVFTYHALNGNAVRRAVGHKLVKTDGDMRFVKLRDKQ